MDGFFRLSKTAEMTDPLLQLKKREHKINITLQRKIIQFKRGVTLLHHFVITKENIQQQKRLLSAHKCSSRFVERCCMTMKVNNTHSPQFDLILNMWWNQVWKMNISGNDTAPSLLCLLFLAVLSLGWIWAHEAKKESKKGVLCCGRRERDEISRSELDLCCGVFNPCTGIVIRLNAQKFII